MLPSGLGNLITYNPWAVAADTSLLDLARLLREHHFHHWPVVNCERQLVGVLSHIDIIQALQARSLALTTIGLARESESEDDCTAGETTAGDIMMPRVVTIAPTGSPRDALRLLLDHHIHSLPVVEAGKLVGIVTSSDFLRELSYGELAGGREPVSTHLQTTTEPVEPDATLEEALLSMHLAGTQYIAVAKDGFPLGVISRREIATAQCRLEARAAEWSEYLGEGPTTLSELVHRSPTLRPAQKLSEAAALLVERQLCAAPVVNQANRLLGIISEDDLLRAILGQLTAR